MIKIEAFLPVMRGCNQGPRCGSSTHVQHQDPLPSALEETGNTLGCGPWSCSTFPSDPCKCWKIPEEAPTRLAPLEDPELLLQPSYRRDERSGLLRLHTPLPATLQSANHPRTPPAPVVSPKAPKRRSRRCCQRGSPG